VLLTSREAQVYFVSCSAVGRVKLNLSLHVRGGLLLPFIPGKNTVLSNTNAAWIHARRTILFIWTP
jgi:hypothetical protein